MDVKGLPAQERLAPQPLVTTNTGHMPNANEGRASSNMSEYERRHFLDNLK
jgi:hypothetical protein